VSMLGFPRKHLTALHELASRVLERRGDGAKPDLLAYDLLDGFYDVCSRVAQDAVLDQLEHALGLSLPDGSALAEEARLRTDLAGKLADRSAYDPRGPRAAKPRQLADCLLATLGLAVTDPEARPVELSDEVREAVFAAIQAVVEPALAGPRLRAAILDAARASCQGRQDVFDRVAPQLDERLAIPRHLKLPIDVVQAVQDGLLEGRAEVLEKIAGEALDRAKDAIAAVDPDAAGRLDVPVTARLTPRQVALQRASDPQLPSLPDVLGRTLLDAITELADIVWGPAVPRPRPYRATERYAVGDHVEHPKFGRGVVQAASTQRIEVEFPDGWHTLVHART
jgi:hypothetical protein